MLDQRNVTVWSREQPSPAWKPLVILLKLTLWVAQFRGESRRFRASAMQPWQLRSQVHRYCRAPGRKIR